MKASGLYILCTFYMNVINAQVVKDTLNHKCATQKAYTRDLVNRFVNEYLDKTTKWELSDNKFFFAEFTKMLNAEFGTNIFDHFCSLRGANFFVRNSDEVLQLGVFEITFNSKYDLEKAKAIVENSKRTNFKLKVLTKFVLLTKEQSLIFVFSETSRNRQINLFMNDLSRAGVVPIPSP